MSARCDKTRLFKASFSFWGVLFLAVLASSLLSACADRPLSESVLSGETMGTTYSVKYINQPGEAHSARTEEEVAANVARLLTHLDKLLSTYQQDSELNQLNRAEVGVDVPVSSILWQVLLIADQTYRDSNGAFDPSVGPLVDLWGFGPTAAPDNVLGARQSEFSADFYHETLEPHIEEEFSHPVRGITFGDGGQVEADI